MADALDLLVELGTEELPPKALKKLSDAFAAAIAQGLGKAGLGHGELRAYAAPRRLAVWIRQLATQQPEKAIERRGPALTAAFDGNGIPTPAARGFARSCGVEMEQLQRLETDKGAWLVYRAVQAGAPAAELIPDIIRTALDALPIPKRMRWGSGTAQFVRPVHWLVVLFGNDVIDCDVLGVRAGRETRGHRFHHPAPLYLSEPAAYAPLLETEGHVLPDFADRREAIAAQVAEAAVQAGGQALIDADLLDEVTALVEWPVAIRGDFGERFLRLPEAVLIATLQGHQRYFPVKGPSGKLLPSFVTVSNIQSSDPDKIKRGNERVVRPRLEDAMFFYERDLATPLASHREALKSVVFQKELGTIDAKVQRVIALADVIAQRLNVADRGAVRRAAELCKCDLMTHMVGEFPELQGVMGRAYAAAQGEDAQVAQALDEQYMPRHAGDAVPGGDIGRILAIADKLDTLCGIFTIGQVPTGDKDPFGLRRAALGVLRIMIESRLDLDLRELIESACAAVSGVKKGISAPQVAQQVFAFMMERLRGYYADRGVRGDVFEAVLAKTPAQPFDFDLRVHAVDQFRLLPEAQSLAAANKRIHNILRQAGAAAAGEISSDILREAAEKTLAQQLAAIQADTQPLLAARDYAAAMTRLAALRGAVDGFFDHVMVMVEDEALRQNRLRLLARLNDAFTYVADISRLQG